MVLILAILLFICYNVFIVWKYKTIPQSLSATVYIASPTLFSSMMGIEAILMLLPWFNQSTLGVLPYASTICLVICASAPLFKESFHKTIHYTSAILALIGILLWIIIDFNGWWLATAVVPAGLTLWSKYSTGKLIYVYWFELWAFLLLSLILLIK